MAKEFKLPNLGENIASAEILKIMVAVGDKIEKNQSILEISSDKATLEVPSDVDGVVSAIAVKEGDSVTEGQTILSLDGDSSAGSDSKEVPTGDKSEDKTEEVSDEKAKNAEEKQDQSEEQSSSETDEASNQSEETSGGSLVFKLPNLGENIAAAEILKVMVAVGDKVEKNQSVLEISSDKATLEVPSDVSGTITELSVKEGDSIKEGDPVFTIETSGGSVKPKAVEKSDNKLAEKPKQDAQKETPKADDKGQSEQKNTDQQQQAPRGKNEGIIPTAYQPKRLKDVAPAAPSVRRFAREIGLDINVIPGTGEGGRISVEDVKTYSRNLNKNGGNVQTVVSSNVSTGGYTETLPDFSKWGEISTEAMNNVRYKTGQHLTFAWNSIPHVTHFEKVDITELENIRKQYSKKVEAAGGKLTMTAILVKIMASALKVFPKFNASIDLDKKQIIYKKYFHIGLAVDTDRGLLVPVIRDANQKNVTQISVEVNQVAEKARSKKLTVEDMQGATFTISNLGGIGGVNFTPVVNYPEVAILGVSRSSYEPVYNGTEFIPRLIMPLSLSYDHRLIDGADAARFMKWVKDAIENPFLIMLEG